MMGGPGRGAVTKVMTKMTGVVRSMWTGLTPRALMEAEPLIPPPFMLEDLGPECCPDTHTHTHTHIHNTHTHTHT